MKQKTLPNGSQEAVWMPRSLHGAKGLQLPWMPPVGLSVCKYVLRRNTEPVGGSKHDAAHGWPIASPHRHVQLISVFDGWWRKLCHSPGRQLNSTTHTTYLTSQQWWDVCKRSWFLICHQVAGKLKASLLPPCASGYLSNEGLARLSLWSRLRFSFFHPAGFLTH